jgi:hypothetical protein
MNRGEFIRDLLLAGAAGFILRSTSVSAKTPSNNDSESFDFQQFVKYLNDKLVKSPEYSTALGSQKVYFKDLQIFRPPYVLQISTKNDFDTPFLSVINRHPGNSCLLDAGIDGNVDLAVVSAVSLSDGDDVSVLEYLLAKHFSAQNPKYAGLDPEKSSYCHPSNLSKESNNVLYIAALREIQKNLQKK